MVLLFEITPSQYNIFYVKYVFNSVFHANHYWLLNFFNFFNNFVAAILEISNSSLIVAASKSNISSTLSMSQRSKLAT
eukprot:UN20436